ncbi:MAG: aminotransferase class V-fold PLP-dependent enzyme [Pseudoxanthomonas sp.]
MPITVPVDDAAIAHLLAAAAEKFVPVGDTLALDCAAHGPRLRSVLEAGQAALAAGTAPWTLSFAEWETRIETLRRLAADTLFEGDVDGVAMVPSAAFALATAARNLPLGTGDAVLVLDGQFPSNLLPWQQRCTETGAHVVAARRVHGQDWTEAVMQAWDATPKVRVVAVPHAHWHDGALLDLERISQRACGQEVAWVLDLSQSLGALPVLLARWQPDFIAAVGHKWLLGPHGLAWLWAAPRWREQGVALDQHWQARAAGDRWAFPIDTPPPYRRGARRFDAGGVADPVRLAMAAAAMGQLHAWGVANISRSLGALTTQLDHALEAQGLSSWITPGHAPHFTALRAPDDRQLELAANALSREGVICTRRAGLLRIAPHLHVGSDDMSRVSRIVAAAVQA